jgi:alpha-ribazole phosphatase
VQFFLIRHPRPLVAAGICYGQLDVEAEDPQPIADRLRPFLPAASVLVASPLRRSRSLAEALDGHAQFDHRLREIDFGSWEGQPWEKIDRRLLDAWAADVLHFVPPDGESAAMLQARVVDCVESLRGDCFALVTHAGVIRALLGHWLQLPVAEWSRLAIAFGSITRCEIDRSGDAGQRPSATLHYLNR